MGGVYFQAFIDYRVASVTRLTTLLFSIECSDYGATIVAFAMSTVLLLKLTLLLDGSTCNILKKAPLPL